MNAKRKSAPAPQIVDQGIDRTFYGKVRVKNMCEGNILVKQVYRKEWRHKGVVRQKKSIRRRELKVEDNNLNIRSIQHTPKDTTRNISKNGALLKKRFVTSLLDKKKTYRSISSPRTNSSKKNFYKKSTKIGSSLHENFSILGKPKIIHLFRSNRKFCSLNASDRSRLFLSQRERAKILTGLNTLIHTKVPLLGVEEHKEGFKSLEIQAEAYKTAIGKYMESNRGFR